MASASYIPASDSSFQEWLLNFNSRLTATPAIYGLIAADAVIVAASYAVWNAAYLVAITPGTRTSAAIAAKDAARASAEAVVRPYAQRIRSNPAVSNAARVLIGVTVAVFPPTPIPAPLTNPVLALVRATPLTHVLAYADADTPTTKAKPYGVKQCTILVVIGLAPAVDPTAARYVGGYTKSPLQITHDSSDRGKIATYFARWENGSGPGGVSAVGPWGTPVSFVVM